MYYDTKYWKEQYDERKKCREVQFLNECMFNPQTTSIDGGPGWKVKTYKYLYAIVLVKKKGKCESAKITCSEEQNSI